MNDTNDLHLYELNAMLWRSLNMPTAETSLDTASANPNNDPSPQTAQTQLTPHLVGFHEPMAYRSKLRQDLAELRRQMLNVEAELAGIGNQETDRREKVLNERQILENQIEANVESLAAIGQVGMQSL